jgi:tetratricopeptide (TPR) repeat protein
MSMGDDLTSRLDSASKLARDGHYGDALKACDRLARSHPDRYEVFEIRGEIHRRKGDLRAALQDVSEVIRLKPKEAAPYFRRGRWHLEVGDLEAAIADFTRVISTDQGYFLEAARLFRAQAYLDRKDFAKALADCEMIPAGYALGPAAMSREQIMSAARTRKSVRS